jgi:hypothetical protein
MTNMSNPLDRAEITDKVNNVWEYFKEYDFPDEDPAQLAKLDYQDGYQDGAKAAVSRVLDLLRIEEELDFNSWLKLGFELGWVGPPVCETHDGLPLTAGEDAEFESGDPCIHIMRCYDGPEMKAEVEANHSPSVWRQPAYGLDCQSSKPCDRPKCRQCYPDSAGVDDV